ncbi:Nucleic-acid-binding protein from transposon X-element [Eumeta japonica]|uniref:Nucleic-acid-binding protein from transposon X-element n=1 Tax=Eumeta variegata TaxID=151549 RepID=A0A4C1T8B1_EUMVA|nr:Nucleic-acid-binding protein from transposon X-element [Eumeta japonica]
MSSLNVTNCEVSVNGRNAYLTVSAEALNANNTNKKTIDSNYLTSKPISRARSVSLTQSTGDLLRIPLLQKNLITSAASSASDSYSSLNQVETIINNFQKPRVQVGMDRYITVVKRARSPKSSKVSSMPKISRDKDADSINSHNRFSLLKEKNDEVTVTTKSSKPPPIYLREKNSNALVKKLISAIGEGTFYVIPIKRGNIDETKIQVNTENDYRKITAELDKNKKDYYTYQLKSAKGMQIVLKGIDSCVDPLEPMFRVELEPNDIKLKKNEIHPIYDLKFLLHRKITVEEPHKRTGPVQCHNCQEYGHTKTYCKLPTVCVVCGELHGVAGVFCCKAVYETETKIRVRSGTKRVACPVAYPLMAQATTKQVSYADAVKNNSDVKKKGESANISPNMDFNYSRLEATVENLVQTINNFTTTMTSMMQEMLRMQSTLLQAIVNKP